MMRQLVFTLVALAAMTGTSFGLVTLDYIVNPDPAPGLKSYTVHVSAPGDAINVLGDFTIAGSVYQVWTAPGVQSEWLHNIATTPGDPKDSYVIFGDLRVSPNGGPVQTIETIYGGGIEGLGTLNNSPPHNDGYAHVGPLTEEADLLHLVVPVGQSVTVELRLVGPKDLDGDGHYDITVTHSFYGPNALHVPAVPEPAALALLVLGAVCLAMKRLR